MSYKIIRYHRENKAVSNLHNELTEVIETGLTLEDAQAHCSRDDTQEKDDNGDVVWFDGYTEELDD